MKGVILTGFGGPDKLEYREDITEPILRPGNVIVIWVRMGALSVKPELPHILGSDISGVVERVGEEVDDIKEFKK